MGKTLKYGVEVTKQEPSAAYAAGEVMSSVLSDTGEEIIKNKSDDK